MTSALDVASRERGPIGRGADVTDVDGRPDRSGRRGRWWLAAVAVTLCWSLIGVGVGEGDLVNSGGWASFRSFWAAAVAPETNGEFLRLTFDAMLTTASFALVGSLLAICIGLVGGVLASQRWWRRELGARSNHRRRRTGWFVTRVGLSVPRGVHEAIWALALVSILGNDPLVAVLALAIPFGAVTAKVYADLIDEADSGPYDALRVAGAGRCSAFTYAIAPQIGRDMLSYGFYRLECAIRSAVVLGVIGAGGLGFQLALSFQSLRYEEIWMLLYATIVLAMAAEACSAVLRRSGSRTRWLSLVVAMALAVGAWIHLRIDVTSLWSDRTRDLFHRYVVESWPPRLPRGGWTELADAALDTLQMSFVGITLSTAIAVPLAFFAARRPGRRWTPVAVVVRLALLVIRSIPIPVWALLALFLLHPGPLPGAVALGLYNLGILGRLLAEVVENVSRHGADAVAELGAPPSLVTLYGVVPRVAGRFTALTLYRWEVIARDSVILGLVGAGGLGQLLEAQHASFDYPRMAGTVLAFIVTTLAVDVISASVRRSFAGHGIQPRRGRSRRRARFGPLRSVPEAGSGTAW